MEELVRTFDEQGYVVVRNVIDPARMAEIKAHVDGLLEASPAGTELVQFASRPDDAFWYSVVSDDRLLDIAQAFLGPNLALFASAYFAKAAKVGKPVLWHQDGDFWPLEPMTAVSLWLSVDASTPENGAMQVIPGSHKLGLQGLQAMEGGILGSGLDPKLVDQSKAVDVVLQPGDVEIHHPLTFHGSPPNTSPMRRCGMAIRYIPASTRILVDSPSLKNVVGKDGKWPLAYMLRGQPVEGVNGYRTPPVAA